MQNGHRACLALACKLFIALSFLSSLMLLFSLSTPPSDSPFSFTSYPAIALSDIVPLETDLPRCVLCGSLDPTTSIFYRAPEHSRIRTTQACDKCRARKAKVRYVHPSLPLQCRTYRCIHSFFSVHFFSSAVDHPVCERCHIRGLIRRYASQRRTRQWTRATAVQDASWTTPIQVRGHITSHRPSSRHTDVDRPRSWGNWNGQRNGGTAPLPRLRRATIASTAIRSLSSSSSQVLYSLICLY